MAYYKLADEKALLGVLENLLKKNIVKGVVVYTAGPRGTFNSLISDPNLIKSAVPMAPVFSGNTATFLRHNGPEKVAVVVKPCEARAINELVKLKQIDRENLVIVCTDCLGTHDPKDVKGKEMRNACTVCTNFTPPESDIAVLSIGVGKGLILSTSREELVEGLSRCEAPAARDAQVKKMTDDRAAVKNKMVTDVQKTTTSVDSLVEMLKFCIRCDNCRDVCPICYCKECYFETPIGAQRTEDCLNQARIKGIVRVPADILFYHLTRNMHVAMGCVECGACEEACPRDIPLLSVWKALAGDVQALFEYRSGMKTAEPMPLLCFLESELE